MEIAESSAEHAIKTFPHMQLDGQVVRERSGNSSARPDHRPRPT
jgi:hypothetical protein